MERKSALGVPNGAMGSDAGGSRRDSYAELLSELQPPRALGTPGGGSLRGSLRRTSNGTRNSFL